MDRHIPMPLFKTIVFTDVMKVVTPDDNGPLHLHLLNNTCQNAPSDRYIPSEWTLFVNVCSIYSLPRDIPKKITFIQFSVSNNNLSNNNEIVRKLYINHGFQQTVVYFHHYNNMSINVKEEVFEQHTEAETESEFRVFQLTRQCTQSNEQVI